MFTKEIKKSKTPEEALASLMRLCSRAEKSTGDAMRLMYTWGVEESRRSEVLEKLIELKFIDNRRYAEAYVGEKVRLSGWGTYKISAALAKKGVSRAIIDDTISEIDQTAMVERLNQKLSRKVRSIKYNSQYELKAKLIRYGLSLGYEYDKVKDAASQLVSQADEFDEFM